MIPVGATYFGHYPFWPRPILATTYFGHGLTDFGHGQFLAFSRLRRGEGGEVGRGVAVRGAFRPNVTEFEN